MPKILLFLLIVVMTACRRDLSDDPSVVVTAKPEFRIDAYEQRDSSTGVAVLGLWVESLQVYDCPGYRIVFEIQKNGTQISIDLLKVEAPTNCIGSPTPVRQFVPIGQLSAGVYDLHLTLGKTLLNEGKLTVETDRFSLDFAQPQGFEIQNYTAYNVPDALLWGYVLITNEAANTAAQSFISDIKTITTDHGLAPGFYSYFTVAGSGQIFFHSSITPPGSTTMFVRKLSAQPNDLRNLLQNYRSGMAGQPEPLTVRCFSTFGEF